MPNHGPIPQQVGDLSFKEEQSAFESRSVHHFRKESLKDYVLVIRKKIRAIDDFDAREKAKNELEMMKIDQREGKLQKVFENKQPQKIEL